MCDNDNIFDNEVICPVDDESERNEKILNSEDVTNITDIQQNKTKVLPFKTRFVIIIPKTSKS